MNANRQRIIQGTVVRVDGNPNPHSFWIQDEDGNEYFAHLGDLTINSGKLLRNENIDTEFLQVNDPVTFTIWEDNIPRAFNVSRNQSPTGE